MEFSFPKALTESESFAELSVEQRTSFSGRLAFAKDVLEEAASWLRAQDGEFSDFADGLELDLSSATSVDMGDTKTQVSPWLIHSSWTFDVAAADLAGLLADDLRNRLDANMPSLSSNRAELLDWLVIELATALLSFDGLRNARSFDVAIANLIAIDFFLGRIMVALFKWRFWNGERP